MIPIDYVAVNLAQYQACAVIDNTNISCYPVAIGKPSTPTPTGIFYVEAIAIGSQVQNLYGDSLGSYLIDVGINPNRPKFRLALHGTSKPQYIGKSVSGGCIRFHDKDIHDLITNYLFNKILIR